MESGGRGMPLPPSVYRSFAPSHALEQAAFLDKPLQYEQEKRGKCHIFGKSAAICHNFFFFCKTLLTKHDRCAIVRIKEDDAVALTASQTIIANPPKGGDAKL